MDYREFIHSKTRKAKPMGFEPGELPPRLFDWQKDVVTWAVRRGRAALFEDCGLGKTLQQLAWADQVYKYTGKPVLILMPIGIRQQTLREAEKFGIEGAYICNDSSEVKPGIALTNYEKLHRIDCRLFAGVVLDESSILKSYTGSIKRQLIEQFSETPYRLACTATPAPNDHMELGNHAEFLGVMPSNEMLSRWFINDTMKAGGYRLAKHARNDFWRWVATWAVGISKPSDLGNYSDEGYVLPELFVDYHIAEVEIEPPPGYFFPTGKTSATTLHAERRQTAPARAEIVAERLAASDDYWLVWCDTDYEADELTKRIPHAIEVRGSDKESSKEAKLSAFSLGEERVLITKPTVAGFGMNWQHCCQADFVGKSFSYEQFYQAVRRIYRFGQKRDVNIGVVLAEGDGAALEASIRKELQHTELMAGIAQALKGQNLQITSELQREVYQAEKKMELPAWLRQTL